MQCGKPSTFFKIPHGGYDLDVVAMAITIVSTKLLLACSLPQSCQYLLRHKIVLWSAFALPA